MTTMSLIVSTVFASRGFCKYMTIDGFIYVHPRAQGYTKNHILCEETCTNIFMPKTLFAYR